MPPPPFKNPGPAPAVVDSNAVVEANSSALVHIGLIVWGNHTICLTYNFYPGSRSDNGPVAQPWRRLSRPKSRSRRSRNGDRWAAIACIAQLGSATAVAGRRQLSRNGDSRRGTATAVAERRQPSPRRQLSRKGYEDHQSAT